MNRTALTNGQEFHKRHVASAVMFAIHYIPQVDEKTLEAFLELVNINGNFDNITERQLIGKMALLMRLVPNVCQASLLTLAELLGVSLPLNIYYEINLFSEESTNLCSSMSSPF